MIDRTFNILSLSSIGNTRKGQGKEEQEPFSRKEGCYEKNC